MSQAVYFVTRYSVVGKAQHTWQIARNAADYESYRAQLLEPDRLARRLQLFTEITAPSVAAQVGTDASASWLVLIAAELPKEHFVQLQEAVRPAVAAGVHVRFLRVAPSDDAADIQAGVYAGIGQAIRMTLELDLSGSETSFATVRLDDDDALATSYSERLLRYIRPEFAGLHVSFSRGLQAVYSANRCLVDTRVVDKPMNAQGLALINNHNLKGFACPEVHVHGFGNHADLSARTPVIVDGAGVSYLRTLDSTNDLGDANHSRHPAASAEQVAALGLQHLEFLPAVLDASTAPAKKRGLFRR
jgi:hypothetical protein